MVQRRKGKKQRRTRSPNSRPLHKKQERATPPPGPPEQPARDRTGSLPQAHVSRPVRGCRCAQCQVHRLENHRAYRLYRQSLADARSQYPLMVTTDSLVLLECLVGSVIHRG